MSNDESELGERQRRALKIAASLAEDFFEKLFGMELDYSFTHIFESEVIPRITWMFLDQ